MLDWLFRWLDDRNDRRYVLELSDEIHDITKTVPTDLLEAVFEEVWANREYDEARLRKAGYDAVLH